MFLRIFSNSSPVNLLLVRNHQAEIIIVKRLIQGRKNKTRVQVEPRSFQARRQYSVTRVSREVYLCEFQRGTGVREIYFSVDQTNKMKTNKKKVFSSKISTNSGCRLKVFAIFHEFLSEDQKKKKKKSPSQNFYEIRCESTKITKIRAENTNLGVLGLDFALQ